MPSEYWFARRFPVGHPRNAMAPVTPAGWLVAIAFALAMLIGGIIFLALALAGAVVIGTILFVAIAVVAAIGFIGSAMRKGDPRRTVEDYRNDHRGDPG